MEVEVLIMKSITFSSTPEFFRSMISALLRWKTVRELRIWLIITSSLTLDSARAFTSARLNGWP